MRYDGMRQQWHRFLAGDAMPVRVGSDFQAGFSGIFLEAIDPNVGYGTGTQHHEQRRDDSELAYGCLLIMPPLGAPAPQVGAATPGPGVRGPGVPGPPPIPAPGLAQPPPPSTPPPRVILRHNEAARFLLRVCTSDRWVRS
jgi:hypothetical protein